jgi:hypothetical protein
MSLGRWLAGLQGFYYLATGVWPIVHIDSFMWVTGPKVDLWLVRMFGVVLAAVSLVFLDAAARSSVRREVVLLACAVGIAIAVGETIFVAIGQISGVYLIDAAIHGVLLIGWGAYAARQGRGGDERASGRLEQ